MLALGQWFIDTKTVKIFNQSDENQPLKLDKQAVQLLIFLAENQHKLIDKYSIIKHLWPKENQPNSTSYEQLLQQLITAITQQLGNNVITITPDHYYLLQLSTFSYQYTPITVAQMKKQLAEKQLIELKKAQQKNNNKSSNVTKMQTNRQQNQAPASQLKKVVLVTLVAVIIAAFVAAS